MNAGTTTPPCSNRSPLPASCPADARSRLAPSGRPQGVIESDRGRPRRPVPGRPQGMPPSGPVSIPLVGAASAASGSPERGNTMSRKIAVISGAVLLVVGLGVTQAWAENVQFTTDFAFSVGKDNLPAGTYTLHAIGNNLQFQVINSADNETKVEVPVRTRLSEEPVSRTNVVFDVVGDRYYLSEIRMPHHDGYLVGSAPGPHTQRVIETSVAK
jgi:hypothetical protein